MTRRNKIATAAGIMLGLNVGSSVSFLMTGHPGALTMMVMDVITVLTCTFFVLTMPPSGE